MYETKAVIIAMIITAVVAIAVTIFCFQTKVRMGKALPWPPCPLTHTRAHTPPHTHTPIWTQHLGRHGRAQTFADQGFP